MWRTHRTVRFCYRSVLQRFSSISRTFSLKWYESKSFMKLCFLSLLTSLRARMVFLSDEDQVRDEGMCLDSECWESVQFCCSMRFSSSSADRSRKAADSRYPAISWRTAATSVWLSWAEAPPPPPFLARLLELDEDEFEARDFILRSVGPEWRGQIYNYRHKNN